MRGNGSPCARKAGGWEHTSVYAPRESLAEALSGVFPAEADGIGRPCSSGLRHAFRSLAFRVAKLSQKGHGELADLGYVRPGRRGSGCLSGHRSLARRAARHPRLHSQGRKAVCMAGRDGSWKSVGSTVSGFSRGSSGVQAPDLKLLTSKAPVGSRSQYLSSLPSVKK